MTGAAASASQAQPAYLAWCHGSVLFLLCCPLVGADDGRSMQRHCVRQSPSGRGPLAGQGPAAERRQGGFLARVWGCVACWGCA